MVTLANILGRQSIIGCLPGYIGVYRPKGGVTVTEDAYDISSNWDLFSVGNVPVVSNTTSDGCGVDLMCQLSPTAIRQESEDGLYLLMVSANEKYALAYIPIDSSTIKSIVEGATYDVKWVITFTYESAVVRPAVVD